MSMVPTESQPVFTITPPSISLGSKESYTFLIAGRAGGAAARQVQLQHGRGIRGVCARGGHAGGET